MLTFLKKTLPLTNVRPLTNLIRRKKMLLHSDRLSAHVGYTLMRMQFSWGFQIKSRHSRMLTMLLNCGPVVGSRLPRGFVKFVNNVISVPMWKERESPWNISPPSIDLHGVSVKLSVACRDDSLYLLPHKTKQAGLIYTGTFIPTIPALFPDRKHTMIEGGLRCRSCYPPKCTIMAISMSLKSAQRENVLWL